MKDFIVRNLQWVILLVLLFVAIVSRKVAGYLALAFLVIYTISWVLDALFGKRIDEWEENKKKQKEMSEKQKESQKVVRISAKKDANKKKSKI